MNHDDLDALFIWIKHYPHKAEKALAQMRNATANAYARLDQTLFAVADNAKQTAAAIEQLTQSLSTTSTKDTIDTLEELKEYVLKGDTIVIDTIPEEITKKKGELDMDYNLTEVNSDAKFDWEETKFVNMTDFQKEEAATQITAAKPKPTQLKTRLCLRCDTTSNWNQNNPTLLKGEIALEYSDDNINCYIKCGDGVRAFKDLPYISMPTPNDKISYFAMGGRGNSIKIDF